ncbi:MAG: c-type cytochrome, partial [Thiotrichales bacterium]
MRNEILLTVALLTLSTLAHSTPAPKSEANDVKANYIQYCAACHGPERLGGWGPVLLPDNLHRLKKDAAYTAIADGLPATQMPGFKDKLSEAEIKALAEWIYTPPTHPPKWDEADIRGSHIVHKENLRLPLKPVFEADPLNVTLVVEHGDNHITVLDGDKMEPFHRFETRHSLHG